MSELILTAEQRRAATTLGCSLMVASAAGSGKTTVLAERCAFLICAAPDDMRCDVSDLAVLTFTEAAAAEMRQRIRQALRARAGDPRCRRQLLLLDDAHISTIHSFCLWLIRQNFLATEADPRSVVLDAAQALLKLHEAVEVVLDSWKSDPPRARRLRDLLLNYFNGREDALASQLVRLHDYQRCLVDGPAWLSRGQARCRMSAAEVETLELDGLRQALRMQVSAAGAVADALRRLGPGAARHLAWLDDQRSFLEELEQSSHRGLWSQACLLLREHQLPAVRGRAGQALATAQAADHLHVLRTAYQRLVTRFGLFSTQQRLDGLARIEPHLVALADLLRAVDAGYSRSKRQAHALDFSDLEQLACGLLTGPDGGPSSVARGLHDRFAHVLVDEFQDVNPLAERIVHLVSRECDPARANNLFCVGDVKQSIYRFRRAQPELTIRRLQRADDGEAGFAAIHLPENHRCAPRLVDGINCVFDRLMTPAFSGLAYDQRARLIAGRATNSAGRPIEMHLVTTDPLPGTADETADAGAEDESDWEAIELQAVLIAARIRRLIEEDGFAPQDVAILLRAASRRAEHLASVLQQLGLATAADTSTGVFESREVKDLLALLAVIDNARQDIPLAAVLRRGVTGIRFDERELYSLRRAVPDGPFHLCVERAASGRLPRPLAEKTRQLRSRLAHFRRLAGQRPLPEALDQILLETGLVAWTSGRPGGASRRAGLLALKRQAEQLDRSQPAAGLGGFLRFLERLRAQDQDLGLADPAAEARDAVRITTVHNSKGLEFPVVFVANLEKPFNLSDSRSTVLYGAEEGIALKVADRQRRIRYPSLLSAQLVEAQRREELAEELRVLYVALTRARERLILVASPGTRSMKAAQRWAGHAGPLPELILLGAGSYLDWLLPVTAATPDLFAVQQYAAKELAGRLPSAAGGHAPLRSGGNSPNCSGSELNSDPRARQSTLTPAGSPAISSIPEAVSSTRPSALGPESSACMNPPISKPIHSQTLRVVASLAPLPAGHFADTRHPEVQAAMRHLEFHYPHQVWCSLPAVATVTEWVHRMASAGAPSTDAGSTDRTTSGGAAALRPRFMRAAASPTPAERGAATHVFLQHFDYRRADELEEQVNTQVRLGRLTSAEARVMDLPAIAWFLNTALGRRVRAAADIIRREVPFLARLDPEGGDQAAGGVSGDFVVLRGMIDLLLPVADGFEVIDFKTDDLPASEVAGRLSVYRRQVRQYAMALARIWGCHMHGGAVVFLGPRLVEQVPLP